MKAMFWAAKPATQQFPHVLDLLNREFRALDRKITLPAKWPLWAAAGAAIGLIIRLICETL